MLPLFDNIPTHRVPVVTYGLIAANFAVWFWELGARAGRIDHYAFYPCAVSGPCLGAARDHVPWPEGTLTAMFMHASWLHILGNMLFYIAGGFAAALAQTFVTLHWSGTAAASIPNVGASGAIAAVPGAYFLLLAPGQPDIRHGQDREHDEREQRDGRGRQRDRPCDPPQRLPARTARS